MTEQISKTLHRPATFKELAARSDSLESFGYNLRDWQHEVSRKVTSHQQFSLCIQDAPTILSRRFDQGDVADAYLAAYAEWLSIEANIPSPPWSKRKNRSIQTPWYSGSNHDQLEELTPRSFRERGLFTFPENVFKPKPGRPRVSSETKRQKAIARQRAYRQRVKSILDQARALGIK